MVATNTTRLWLTATEAAQTTGYSEVHLRKLAREGKLIAEKPANDWLFYLPDIERYESENKGGYKKQ